MRLTETALVGDGVRYSGNDIYDYSGDGNYMYSIMVRCLPRTGFRELFRRMKEKEGARERCIRIYFNRWEMSPALDSVLSDVNYGWDCANGAKTLLLCERAYRLYFKKTSHKYRFETNMERYIKKHTGEDVSVQWAFCHVLEGRNSGGNMIHTDNRLVLSYE